MKERIEDEMDPKDEEAMDFLHSLSAEAVDDWAATLNKADELECTTNIDDPQFRELVREWCVRHELDYAEALVAVVQIESNK